MALHILYFCASMNSGFKYKYRQKAIQKAQLNTQRMVAFPQLQSVKLVGLVVNDQTSAEQVKKVFGSTINVHVLEFINRKREKGEMSSSVFLNDLNFWGLPSTKSIEHFTSTQFDLLINYTGGENDAIEYTCAMSVAQFKTSSQQFGKIYDLVISGSNSYQAFLNEIKRTLINLNIRA